MGTFPAMPAGYMYDLTRDGTIIRWVNRSTQGLLSTWNGTQIGNLTNMGAGVAHSASLGNQQLAMVVLFPENRAITGTISRILSTTSDGNAQPTYVYGSVDSNDGSDGTWGALLATLPSTQPISYLRTPVTIIGTYKALMFLNSYTSAARSTVINAHSLQVFGSSPPAGLSLWDPTNDVVLGPSGLDHEDLYVGAPESTKTFRVKNLSSATANNVTISINNVSGYGSLFTATTFDIGGGYQSSVQIASIAPGAISPVISMKRAVPVALAAGTIEMAQVQAVATSWT